MNDASERVPEKVACTLLSLIRTIFLLGLALWFGASTYFSMAATELFAQLPVDRAASALGVIFPPFFTLCAILGVLCTILYAWMGRILAARGGVYRTILVLLVLGTLMSLANRLWLLPHIEGIEARMGPISRASSAMLQEFGIWHGISLLLACITLVFLIVVWILIGIRSNLSLKKGVSSDV